jgi:NAD(P)-dependent dehydrogenase (short-subunit alcohol dehydrogenase family)
MKVSELFNVRDYGAIVTGGASGIGLGYVEALAANGARVTMLDLHAGRVAEECKRLTAAGLEVQGKVLDVTDHAALDRCFDEVVAEYGRLDVVFANAIRAWAFSAHRQARSAHASLKARSRTTPMRAGIAAST